MADDRQPRLTRRGLLAAGAAAAVAPRLDLGRIGAPRAPVPVAAGLAIWPRDSWAPGPPTGPIAAEEVRFLLVHHTAESTQHTSAQVPSILSAMYAYHTGPKGWPDIAYNFLVDREGGVWEGRAGSLAGPVAADATGGSQGFDQLVCFIGDFTSVTPTAAAVASGNRTLAWLADRYGIDTAAGAKVTFVSRGSNKWPAGKQVTTSTIAGHREMSTTACPGNAFYPYVRDQMQAAVQDLRGGVRAAPPPPSTAAPTTAAATTSAPPTSEATTTTGAATTSAPPTTEVTTTTAAPTTTEATTTTAAPTTEATTTAAAATTAAPRTDEVAAAPDDGGSGGVSPVVPIAAATAVAGGALLWLRQRGQHDPEAEEPSS